MMCGKQDLALRGHRDSGQLVVEKSERTNEASKGNFRELLRYRVMYVYIKYRQTYGIHFLTKFVK
jgi:hypothetical protein